jgi:xylulokinase
LASQLPTGAANLQVLPFGNGAERIFNNKIIGAHLLNLDLNKHTAGHIYRAVQEGIAFAFKYGLDIMRENNIQPNIIRAGNANLFLSPLFLEAFVNTTQVPVELYETDGSIGAAKGGGIGAGIYKNAQEAFSNFSAIKKIEPSKALSDIYQLQYASWHQRLQNFI